YYYYVIIILGGDSMADGKYTQSELNQLYVRLRNLESQNRDDSGAKQEIENLRSEIEWAKKHLE
ncbi:MAG: hypothetical protein K1W39_13920, partial [Lachnospiraceae bacterium]